ncbi:Phosphotransferase [Fasciolopsis buskii]|uniref:Phosphotransferase n=1 Tax=Fasciolopsis buskii TaxID=27845 RepID=A0A8E0S3G4_9TREM|nr:Phosphotransferase [Fasciolopsis buski]
MGAEVSTTKPLTKYPSLNALPLSMERTRAMNKGHCTCGNPLYMDNSEFGSQRRSSVKIQPADEKLFQKVMEIMKPFDLSVNQYNHFCDLMSQSMDKGLKVATHDKASIKMFPTYVSKIPDGTVESGHYLALDLGGTNYRVLLVHLEGRNTLPRIEERTYAIPHSKMSGTGDELFDYIAKTLADFIKSHGIAERRCDLGFTFSFPCEQKGLTNALLVRWTKGFSATGVTGNNVAKLLQDAVDRAGANVQCVAVVNDTVGTLASCALEDPRSAVGLIVGTGCNAAYIERSEKVELMEEKSDEYVVINTEWGAFGEAGELDLIRTQFDKSVDTESINPGRQPFEKMVAGMYLGEIVRHILVYLVKQKLLLRGEMPEKFMIKEAVATKYLTEVERDPPHLSYRAHYMLTEDLEVPVVDPIDDRIVRYVCELVTKRAAYLIGAGIACLLRRMNRKEVTVGIDGSLYKFHPRFCERMTDIIDKLKPENCRFHLRLSEDGSGKGAAAIAAAASR